MQGLLLESSDTIKDPASNLTLNNRKPECFWIPSKKERGRKEKPETRGSSLCYSADYKLGRMLTSECSPQNAHLTLSPLVTPVFQHDAELVSWMRRMWHAALMGSDLGCVIELGTRVFANIQSHMHVWEQWLCILFSFQAQ